VKHRRLGGYQKVSAVVVARAKFGIGAAASPAAERIDVGSVTLGREGIRITGPHVFPP
jgi:hypothetical protein